MEFKYIKMVTLNEQQRAVVESDLGDMKVLGNPGVGKTTLMVYKIARHMKRQDLHHRHDFLVVTFTNHAQSDFIQKSRGYGFSFFSRTNVLTLHKLAGRILRWFKIRPLDVSTMIYEAGRHLQHISDDRLREVFPTLRLIVVDEAQDISHIQYQFLLQLQAMLGLRMMLIGDPNQNIFQFQGGSDRFLLGFPSTLTFTLTINNRSVQDIVRFANYFRPNAQLPPMKAGRGGGGPSEHGHAVTVYHLPVHELLHHVLEIVNTFSEDRSSLAIIGPVKRSKRYGHLYTNIGLSLVENLFHRHQIPFVQHYPDTEQASSSGRKKPVRCPGHVNLHTIHSAKGDEFHTVILLNFHFFTQGRRPTTEMYNQYMYLWWVAITRARDRVMLLIDREKDHWPMLQYVPPDAYAVIGDPIVTKSFEVEDTGDTKPALFSQLLKSMDEAETVALHTTLAIEALPSSFLAIDESSRQHLMEVLGSIGCTDLLVYAIQVYVDYLVWASQQRVAQFVSTWKDRFQSQIVLGRDHVQGLRELLRHVSLPFRQCSFDDIASFKDQWASDHGRNLFGWLQRRLVPPHKKYMILVENDITCHDSSVVEDALEALLHSTTSSREAWKQSENASRIFLLALYLFQVDHEKQFVWQARQRWVEWMVRHIFSLWHESLHAWIESTVGPSLPDVLFSYEIHHHLRLRGMIHRYQRHPLVYHMFTFSFTPMHFHHVHEIVLLAHADAVTTRLASGGPPTNMDNPMEMHVWNFVTGTHTQVLPTVPTSPFHHWKIVQSLCRTLRTRLPFVEMVGSVRWSSGTTRPKDHVHVIDYWVSSPSLGLWISTSTSSETDHPPSSPSPSWTSVMDGLFTMCDRPLFIVPSAQQRRFVWRTLFPDFVASKTVRYGVESPHGHVIILHDIKTWRRTYGYSLNSAEESLVLAELRDAIQTARTCREEVDVLVHHMEIQRHPIQR